MRIATQYIHRVMHSRMVWCGVAISRERPMPRALDVAGYFLSLQDDNAGDSISNMKLQKLLYYAQGFRLAERGEPLFNEHMEAWQHGPVVPAVYHEFKEFGGSGLPRDYGYRDIDKDTAVFLDEIYRVYGQFSAWKLSKMTHDEPPWRETDTSDVISHQALQRYFVTQLGQ
jgi:uncharacterized phage-associated protein